MFPYFLSEYKKKIHKGNLRDLRNVPIVGWLLFGSAFLFAIGFASTTWTNVGQSVKPLFFFLGFLVTMGAFAYWGDRHLDKTRDIRLRNYQERKLQPLIDLLKNSKFSFYSIEKIDWLISCCETELKGGKNPLGNLPDSFFKWVFPVITLFLGSMIDDVAPSLASNVVVIVSLLWILAILVKIPASYLLDYLTCPDKEALLYLKSDLEYIRLFVNAPIKLKCECTKIGCDGQITQAGFTVDNVLPGDRLIEALRGSGKTLEEISFRKYYKYYTEECSCIGTLPYIIRGQKYVWDEYIENVTVMEFMDTHHLSSDDTLEIETFGPCGAGGIDDLFQLWEAIWPPIHRIGELMGWAAGIKEFINMLPKPRHRNTEEEVVPPNAIFDAIYKETSWTSEDLAQKMDLDTKMAKCFLGLLGYTWDRKLKCYTITEEKMEECYSKLNKAQQAINQE